MKLEEVAAEEAREGVSAVMKAVLRSVCAGVVEVTEAVMVVPQPLRHRRSPALLPHH